MGAMIRTLAGAISPRVWTETIVAVGKKQVYSNVATIPDEP